MAGQFEDLLTPVQDGAKRRHTTLEVLAPEFADLPQLMKELVRRLLHPNPVQRLTARRFESHRLALVYLHRKPVLQLTWLACFALCDAGRAVVASSCPAEEAPCYDGWSFDWVLKQMVLLQSPIRQQILMHLTPEHIEGMADCDAPDFGPICELVRFLYNT